MLNAVIDFSLRYRWLVILGAVALAVAGGVSMRHLDIYTIPEVAAVGDTEAQLREKGVPYVVGRADYARNPRGKIVGDEGGFLKLLFREPDLALVGVHMIGELATELVHTGLMVMRAGGGMDLILNTCFNYPTLGNLFKQAAYAALLTHNAGGKDTPIYSRD